MNPQAPNPRFSPVRRSPSPGRDFVVPSRPDHTSTPLAHNPHHQAHRAGLDTLGGQKHSASKQPPTFTEPTQSPHTFTPHPPSIPSEHYHAPTPPPPPPEPAPRDTHHQNYKNLVHRFLKGGGWVAGFALLIGGSALLINGFLFQSYYVEGSSMQPTLSDDDRLIIDKTGRSTARLKGQPYIPKRGDIIVLDSFLGSSETSQQLIKRVIGVPGDIISIKNDKVTVTNSEHPDGFDIDKELGLDLGPTFEGNLDESMTVPENHVFVLGDNRTMGGSYDSRMFGTISSDKIEGRLIARILPFGKTGIF